MMRIKRSVLPATVVAAAMTMPAFADRTLGETIDDAWIDGSVETALLFNRHLNNFKIDTDVRDGGVVLSGTVESDIDRDLAGEIAKGVKGVRKVDNRLSVEPAKSASSEMAETAQDDSRNFRQWADDATTTAEVKSKLLANRNTQGMKIDVTTRSNVVTLSGTVASAQESELAQKIAENVDGVARVDNQLKTDVAARR